MKDANNFFCVLDASVALSWVMPDEPDNLLLINTLSNTHRAMVPHYWLAEMLNAILSATRRQRFSLNSAHQSLALVQSLPHGIKAIPQRYWGEWLDIAVESQLTIYDAGYLFLAKTHHLPLATADKAMMRAAQSLNIALIDL